MNPMLVSQQWHLPYGKALLEAGSAERVALIAEAQDAIFTRYLELSVSLGPTKEGVDLLRAVDALSQLRRTDSLAKTLEYKLDDLARKRRNGLTYRSLGSGSQPSNRKQRSSVIEDINIQVQYVGFEAKASMREYKFTVRGALNDISLFTLTIRGADLQTCIPLLWELGTRRGSSSRRRSS